MLFACTSLSVHVRGAPTMPSAVKAIGRWIGGILSVVANVLGIVSYFSPRQPAGSWSLTQWSESASFGARLLMFLLASAVVIVGAPFAFRGIARALGSIVLAVFLLAPSTAFVLCYLDLTLLFGGAFSYSDLVLARIAWFFLWWISVMFFASFAIAYFSEQISAWRKELDIEGVIYVWLPFVVIFGLYFLVVGYLRGSGSIHTSEFTVIAPPVVGARDSGPSGSASPPFLSMI